MSLVSRCPQRLRSADVVCLVLAGEDGAGGDQVCRGALEDDSASVVAGAGAEVDDPVGVRHETLPFSPMRVASLSRCRSPPESVVSGWPRLRYPSPTSPRGHAHCV